MTARLPSSRIKKKKTSFEDLIFESAKKPAKSNSNLLNDHNNSFEIDKTDQKHNQNDSDNDNNNNNPKDEDVDVDVTKDDYYFHKNKNKNKNKNTDTILETSSNSNHSTCSLANLSVIEPIQSSSLFSHISSTSNESKLITQKEMSLELFLQSLSELNNESPISVSTCHNISSTACGFRLFEKSLQILKSKSSKIIINTNNKQNEVIEKSKYIEIPLSYCSSLIHCFNLGDCSRLISECQNLVLRYEFYSLS